MSMYPDHLGPIPEETARVARAACPKGTLAMRLRDEFAGLYRDEQFAHLYVACASTIFAGARPGAARHGLWPFRRLKAHWHMPTPGVQTR